MSSSLDKLKALTSRLEEQLAKKETVQEHSTKEQAAAIPAAEEKSVVPSVPAAQKTDTKKDALNEVRKENIDRVSVLYEKLKIFEKSPNFNDIFIYKAMNLSGIGLKEEDFAEVREGKYIQIIAITYEPDKNGKKKAKNVSLGYFGKAETLDGTLKNEIIEFVLRWRYEKAFQNVEHYKDLIARIDTPKETLF
ncbi:hypothetical protein [Sulfurovum sp.]|uniref:hypothetical protein n=1 Tax=Sulfurovum sp. TaxID=1969726 RepID=UPI0025FFF8DB|nr:hypothetical protein [Sulfurovum sp.]